MNEKWAGFTVHDTVSTEWTVWLALGISILTFVIYVITFWRTIAGSVREKVLRDIDRLNKELATAKLEIVGLKAEMHELKRENDRLMRWISFRDNDNKK